MLEFTVSVGAARLFPSGHDLLLSLRAFCLYLLGRYHFGKATEASSTNARIWRRKGDERAVNRASPRRMKAPTPAVGDECELDVRLATDLDFVTYHGCTAR